MREYFEKITKELFKNISNNEILIVNFDAEESTFVRLNKARIRQAGNVKQISITLSLSNKEKRNLKSLYNTQPCSGHTGYVKTFF